MTWLQTKKKLKNCVAKVSEYFTCLDQKVVDKRIIVIAKISSLEPNTMDPVEVILTPEPLLGRFYLDFADFAISKESSIYLDQSIKEFEELSQQDADDHPALKSLLAKSHKEQIEQGFLGQLLAKGNMSCYPDKKDGTTKLKMEIDIGDETGRLTATIWGPLAVAVNNRLQIGDTVPLKDFGKSGRITKRRSCLLIAFGQQAGLLCLKLRTCLQRLSNGIFCKYWICHTN